MRGRHKSRPRSTQRRPQDAISGDLGFIHGPRPVDSDRPGGPRSRPSQRSELPSTALGAHDSYSVRPNRRSTSDVQLHQPSPIAHLPKPPVNPSRSQQRPSYRLGQQRLILGLLVVLAACGGEDAQAPQSSAIVGAPGYSPPVFDELPPIFKDRLPPVSEQTKAHMASVDPARAGWSTEVIAQAAEARTKELFVALIRPTFDATVINELTTADFGGIPRLVPSETRIDYDDGNLSVTTATSLDSTPTDPATVAEELRGTLVEGPATVEVRVVSVDADDGAGWSTRARVRFATRGRVRLQRDYQLTSKWTGQADAPKLRSVALDSWYEARSERRSFVDVTQTVFGKNKRYGDLMRGVEAYFGRVDPAIGSPFQGMQGLAVGDVNGDGLEDVYICQQAGLPDQLMIKEPNGTAVDCAQPAFVNWLDVSRTTLIVDLDNDGHQDLVQALGALIAVSYNDGNGQFPPPTTLTADGGAQFYSLSCADADGDGDLDLFAGRYALEGVMHGVPTPYYDARNGSSNYFWTNDGRSFTDATASSGLDESNTRFTLASIWEDFDEDGDMDLYVVNDFGSNQMFENDGSGKFTDVAAKLGILDIGAGMGATVGDFDLDGDMDLYVTNRWSAAGQRIAEQRDRFLGGSQPEVLQWYSQHASGSSLYVNDGSGRFEDRSEESGAAIGYWGWGGRFSDLNGDGYEDLYVPCGQMTHPDAELDLEAFFWHGVITQSPAAPPAGESYRDAFGAIHHMVRREPYSWSGKQRNLTYLNLGGERFVDVSVAARLDDIGDGRAVANLDWDEDGREDLLIKSRTAPRLRLLLNRWKQEGAWIAFELQGTTSNRDAIGARVSVESNGRVQKKRVYAGDGYLSQSSKRLTFALSAAETVDRVTVEWPGGSRETFERLATRRRHRLVQGQAKPQAVEPVAGLIQGLAQARPSVPKPDQAPVTRVVPVLRLPIGPFPIPSVEQPNRKIKDLVGSPVLVHLFTAAHASGEAGLKEIQASKAELEAIGTRVVCLSVDEGQDRVRAREMVAAAGLEADFGYADGATRSAYEPIVFEVIGPFESVPLPLSFLCDASGLLVAAYIGLPYGKDLRADLPKVALLRPDRPTTIALSWRQVALHARPPLPALGEYLPSHRSSGPRGVLLEHSALARSRSRARNPAASGPAATR